MSDRQKAEQLLTEAEGLATAITHPAVKAHMIKLVAAVFARLGGESKGCLGCGFCGARVSW
jgi:hypothetical protein